MNNDNLYFFVHIRDDYQSYAVTPQECVAHWLADSVEFLIDPRGDSSLNNFDTGTTFKLGVFPFTNDPSNFNGNGVNGPCWERDADNHQGYATGPLAATVDQAPNAPGVQVVSTATWVGSNSTTVDHSYGAAGGYNLEVKIPLADLPSAVGPTSNPPTGSAATNTINPLHLGLNITPYDEDNTAAAGTTTLRHIDQSTRLALVERHRRRPGRSVPLGPRLHPGLHASGGPVDHADDAERVAPEPRRRALAADDLPVCDGRRADLGPQPGAGERQHLDRQGEADEAAAASARERAAAADPAAEGGVRDRRHGAGHRPHLPVDGRPREHPGVPVELRDGERPAAGLRLHALRGDRRRHPALVARHERSRRQAGRRDVHEEGQAEGQDRPRPQSQYDKLAADGSALISFETPNDEVQALFVPDFDK